MTPITDENRVDVCKCGHFRGIHVSGSCEFRSMLTKPTSVCSCNEFVHDPGAEHVFEPVPPYAVALLPSGDEIYLAHGDILDLTRMPPQHRIA
jgi:hypothetical protein